MTPISKGLFLCVAACFIALLVIERVLSPDPRVRNYEVFTEMVYSRANESQSPSVGLGQGMTQQPLVEGVVVRGHLPFPYGPGPEEAQRAGRELRNPFGDDPEVLTRGAEIYGIYCIVCHGVDGAGQGRVVQRGMLPPPPYRAARAMEIEDGEMFHVLTVGQGNMASYAAQVSVDDRWKVIRHVRKLQEAPQ